MYTNKLHPNPDTSHSLSWSPLPIRSQKLQFTVKKALVKPTKSIDKPKDLYPNCDVNVWLRSCEKEIIEPIRGEISGAIPKWLKGALIRNGPGSLKAGNEYFEHLFDSSALLHRFAINEGSVTYQCRFLASECYKRNWRANRIIRTEFGTQASAADPCHSIFQRVAAIFNPKLDSSTDNSMITVYPFNDQLYAFGETPKIHKINPETLETEKRVDVSDYVSIVHHSAHPHVTSDGIYNLALSIYSSGPHHSIVKFPVGKQEKDTFEEAEIVAQIPVRWTLNPSYMHTFGITENYFAIVEQPLSISIGGMVVTKLKNEPLAGCFRWYQNEKTQISLVSRKTGKLAYKFITKTFFFLHIINQYEISDFLVLDICIYQDPSMLDCMFVETMKTMQQNENYARMFRSKPVRFVLPLNPTPFSSENLVTLKNSKAEAYFIENSTEIELIPEKLSDLGCETPRINYDQHLGREYRFFYAISADVDAVNPGTILKIDTKTRQAKTWSEPNCYPSEPIFVPEPGAAAEDDGVILASLVWGRGDENRAGLLVLDARSMAEVGRAEFRTEGPVPKCLHGWFVS